MWIIHAKNANSLRDPEVHHISQLSPKSGTLSDAGLLTIKVWINDIFVFLGWIFSILHRAVLAPCKPRWMLDKPGMIGRALHREIQSDFHSMVGSTLNQPLEVLERAQLRMYRIMATFRRSDRVGAAGIIGRRAKGIVLAFSILSSNGMNGREVQNIKTHLLDGRQALNNVHKRAVHFRCCAAGPGKELVPTCKRSPAPLNPQRVRHRARGFKASLAPCAYRVTMGSRQNRPKPRLPAIITQRNHGYLMPVRSFSFAP